MLGFYAFFGNARLTLKFYLAGDKRIAALVVSSLSSKRKKNQITGTESLPVKIWKNRNNTNKIRERRKFDRCQLFGLCVVDWKFVNYGTESTATKNTTFTTRTLVANWQVTGERAGDATNTSATLAPHRVVREPPTLPRSPSLSASCSNALRYGV